MPLPSSFWVDEMGTAFVVQHGASDPSLRVAPQVPASIYYALPALANRWFGLSEVAYRVPSVLALALALLLVVLVARKLINPEAGWFAAFACLTLRGFNYQAADARPYALGTLVLCACVWLLMRWLESGAWRYAALFAVGAALLWRVHLIFWPVYAIFAIYVFTAIASRETRVGFGAAALVFAAIAASLLPVAMRALGMLGDAQAHVIVPQPAGSDLVSALKIGMITTSAGGAALLSRWRGWRAGDTLRGRGAVGLLLAWWLVQPLALFAFSWITHNSVFVPRYMFVTLPGAALAATAVAAAFIPRERLPQVSLAAGVGVLLFMGQWNRLWPNHHNSDWRGAATALAKAGIASDDPVLCPSPFIEARSPVWRPDYPTSTFLYSPLLVYRVQGRPVSLPFESSPEAEAFAAALSRNVLTESRRFAIYGGDRNVMFWRDWLLARPELAGWTVRRLGPFGDVDAVVFEGGQTRAAGSTASRP